MPQPRPFPGMDPYLESEWEDVHALLNSFARIQLSNRLPDDLRVRSEKRVLVESMEDEIVSTRPIYPDVMVTEPAFGSGGVAVAKAHTGAATALEEPLVVLLPELEVEQRFLKIVDAANGNVVVTVIEFLSPSNKRAGDGRDKYLRKRQDCLESGVNYVEIDLTREGSRRELLAAALAPKSHRTEFYAGAFRATHRHQVEVYALPLWAPLPAVRIPLRPQDADVRLELQPLIDEIRTRGGYDLDYSQPCRPPLSPADQAELQRRLTVQPV